MRLDAWADITVPLLGQTYTKTLRAYIELDPCSFVFHVAFEGYSYTKVLLSYEWGMFELSVDYVVEMSVHYMLVLEVVKNKTLTLSTESLDLILVDLFYLSINIYI